MEWCSVKYAFGLEVNEVQNQHWQVEIYTVGTFFLSPADFVLSPTERIDQSIIVMLGLF